MAPVPRRAVLAAAAAGGQVALQPAIATLEAAPESTNIVPLSLCGGAYCMAYTIDDQPFRAVVDTGSPFILVDGSCDAAVMTTSKSAAMATVWGCFRGAGRPSGLPDTDELFGGEDVGVQWRRGRFAADSLRIQQLKAAGDEVPRGEGLRSTSALFIENATFGVVRSYVGKGGGGAVFLGLAKRRLARIRPTLLEQSEIAAMRFDFIGRQLQLSKRPLIPKSDDALPLVDLRLAGAPVANYAVKVMKLLINGEMIKVA